MQIVKHKFDKPVVSDILKVGRVLQNKCESFYLSSVSFIIQDLIQLPPERQINVWRRNIYASRAYLHIKLASCN